RHFIWRRDTGIALGALGNPAPDERNLLRGQGRATERHTMLLATPAFDELDNLASVRIARNDRVARLQQVRMRAGRQAAGGFRVTMATVAVQREDGAMSRL